MREHRGFLFALRFALNRILVRSSGFEPPRYCYRQPLKLVRLPVPPLPHVGDKTILAAGKQARNHKPVFQSSATAGSKLKPSVFCAGFGVSISSALSPP